MFIFRETCNHQYRALEILFEDLISAMVHNMSQLFALVCFVWGGFLDRADSDVRELAGRQALRLHGALGIRRSLREVDEPIAGLPGVWWR